MAISEFFSSFGQEVKLTIYGVFLLLCFLMTFAFAFIPYVYDEVLDVQVAVDLKLMVLNLSMDIFGVVNPFGLVLMSTALREKLTEFLLFGRSAFSPRASE